jgi:MATE family multidrug resistance protein
LAAPLLAAISDNPAAGGHTQTYFGIRILGAPLALVFVALRESRYAVGDARTPMRATLLANGLNIVLDYLLIFQAGWGVAGAAWASVAAQGAEMIWLVFAERKFGYGLRTVGWTHLASVCRVGLPSGLQFVLEIGSFMMLAGLIAAMSEVEMAAHQIAIQVIHFSFLPAYAVSEAASVLTGQAVGAGREGLVRPVAHAALRVTGVYTALCTVILLTGADWIVSGFGAEARVHLAAVHLLWVAAVFQVADGAYMVARGALTGTGDVRWPAVIGIATAWAMTPPLTWLLGHLAGLGALGGWLGLCAEIFIGSSILWWRLERGHWLGPAARAREQLRVS